MKSQVGSLYETLLAQTGVLGTTFLGHGGAAARVAPAGPRPRAPAEGLGGRRQPGLATKSFILWLETRWQKAKEATWVAHM